MLHEKGVHMKKSVIFLLVASVIFISLNSCATSGLPGFGSEIGIQANPIPGGEDIRIPYTDNVSYFGYVQPGAAPDAVSNGKKMYYVYVWIPLVAPELGMRMVSPVPAGMAPTETDFVAADYEAGKTDTTNYFDTWITLDRANEVIMPADIATKAATATWTNYGSNDDSSELPAQPSGNKYNSVLRVVSEPSDPLKALVRGLYRIGFTTYKVGEVQGTFLAQIGAPIKIPGVQVSKTLEGLAKVVKD